MHVEKNQFTGLWAVVLGGSSGFGLATVKKLASHGMNIAILYREISITEGPLKQELAELAKQNNVSILTYNSNALDPKERAAFLEHFALVNETKGNVRLLLHSIARGNLKPLISGNDELSVQDIELTTYAMSNSLLDWARALLSAQFFYKDARIIGLTSEGSHRYIENYAAVSIAKVSLQSLVMHMAVELSPFGIRTNLIQAGVTETPSLKRIPGSAELIDFSKRRNPMGRLTMPEDVADMIYLLCTNEAAWVNGSLIHVDGGEHCR